MPKYYGCPCEGCGKPLTLQDDIVVCPDCGAPYHRTCYEKMGLCIHAPAHGAGYEWKFPYQDAQLRTCPTCGERTLRSENVCRCCGAALPPETEADEQLNDRKAAQDEQHGGFDYERFYRQYEQQTMDPLHRNLQAAFGKDELIDGIPSSDWMTYIGTAAPAYLNDYSRMQLQHTKISLSFSALLFVPTLLQMMQITGSSLSLGLSDSTYVVLGRVVSLASFALMLVRGMFAKWFYRKSAAEHIRRIRAEFPDDAQRSVVLSAQGGVSWGAVLGSLLLLMVFGACCSMLLGPNLDVLLNALS